MIDWVDAACIAWGRVTRWIVNGRRHKGELLVEGYPSTDTIAKARDGLLSMGAGVVRQHFPEVRVGDALDVARAMRGEPDGSPPSSPMPLELSTTMFAEYVAAGGVRQRVELVGEYLRVELTRTEYYRNVDRAHYFLSGRIGARNR